MKKDTLLEIVLGTVGGLIFAVGMCLCLVTEWNTLKIGVVVTLIGFIILLCIIPIYRKSHPKKERGPIDWSIVFTWVIGVLGSLVMGFGMSKILVGDPSVTDMVIGMITGVVGLITCVLNYPIYAYVKSNKEK